MFELKRESFQLVPAIAVQISRYVTDDQPGWVECHLMDSSGLLHTFIEKAPVVSPENLSINSNCPRPGFIGCHIEAEWTNEAGQALCRVNTEVPWGVASTAGLTRFTLFSSDVVRGDPWAMRIDPAQPEDAHAVAEIHVSAWRAAYASILSAEYLASLSVEQREAMWRKCIAAGEPELLVAKRQGAVVGWLSFGASRGEGAPKSEAEVWALYVAPECWSTGAGRQLWLRARGLMRDRGFTTCSLWVFPQNERAIRFYRAAGFVADARPAQVFELGGRQLQEVRYVCSLGDAGNGEQAAPP